MNKQLQNIFSSKYAFAIFFSLLLLVHLLFTFCGFYGNDDAIYARYAALFAQTGHLNSNITDHYNLRWSCIAVTAFFYKLFSVNAISSALFSFTCFVITAFVMNAMIAKEKIAIRFLANVFFFLNYSVIFYAHRLLPDAGICLFVFLAYYFYHRQRFINTKHAFIHASLFSISILAAIVTKETIFITLPLWVFLFISDLLKRRNIKFWLAVIVSFCILLFFYLLYFKIETGDWFYRYHLLLEINAGYGDGTGAAGLEDTMKRIGYTLWQSFLLNGDVEYLLPAVVALFYLRKVMHDERMRLMAISFFILLLSADFMSFSPVTYAPLLPDPRHFLFVIPFAVVPAGYLLYEYCKNPEKFLLLPVCFVIATLVIFLLPIGNTKYIYLAITIVVLLRLLFVRAGNARVSTNLLCVAIMMVMSTNYIYDFVHSQYGYYFDQQKIVQESFEKTANKINVFTGDPQTARMGDYFLEFKKNNVSFLVLNDSNLSSVNSLPAYLLLNGDYNAPFWKKTNEILQQKDYFSNVKLLIQEHNSALYEIDDKSILEELKAYSTNQYW